MMIKEEVKLGEWMEEVRKQFSDLAKVKDKDFDLGEVDARFLRDHYPMLFLVLTSGPQSIRETRKLY